MNQLHTDLVIENDVHNGLPIPEKLVNIIISNDVFMIALPSHEFAVQLKFANPA